MKIKKRARDKERLAKIIDMVYKQGMTLQAVAEVFNVSKQAISFLLTQEGCHRRKYLSDEEVSVAYREYIADPAFPKKPHKASYSTYIRYFKNKGLALRRDRRPKYTKEYTEKVYKDYMKSPFSLIEFGEFMHVSSSTLTKYFGKYGLKPKKRGWEGYWDRKSKETVA